MLVFLFIFLSLFGYSCSTKDDIDVAGYPTALVMINGKKRCDNEFTKIKWIIISQQNICIDSYNRISVGDYPVFSPENGSIYIFSNGKVYKNKITVPPSEILNTLNQYRIKEYSIEKLIKMKW